MFGLVVLAVSALYLGLMFVTVRFAWRQGLASGCTRCKAFGYAALAALTVYLPVFWNHIPTLAVHRYHCAQDAGFTAYVEAQDWQAKNSEAVALVNQLPSREKEGAGQAVRTSDGFDRYEVFGGLLHADYRSVQVGWKGLPVWRSEHRISDAHTGETLAKAVDYSAGYGTTEDLRWWLRRSSCVTSRPTAVGEPVKPVEPRDILHLYKRNLWRDSS